MAGQPVGVSARNTFARPLQGPSAGSEPAQPATGAGTAHAGGASACDMAGAVPASAGLRHPCMILLKL